MGCSAGGQLDTSANGRPQRGTRGAGAEHPAADGQHSTVRESPTLAATRSAWCLCQGTQPLGTASDHAPGRMPNAARAWRSNQRISGPTLESQLLFNPGLRDADTRI